MLYFPVYYMQNGKDKTLIKYDSHIVRHSPVNLEQRKKIKFYLFSLF